MFCVDILEIDFGVIGLYVCEKFWCDVGEVWLCVRMELGVLNVEDLLFCILEEFSDCVVESKVLIFFFSWVICLFLFLFLLCNFFGWEDWKGW